MKRNVEIRKIIKSDNFAISFVIKNVLTELKANIKGTAFYDKETDAMFEAYQMPNAAYYVALLDDKIIGGCGINRLSGQNESICELQKMYVLKEGRNLKIGKQLLDLCLDFAKKHYQSCYLETFPHMYAAIKLYKKNGFKPIKNALGNTNHSACQMWMIKRL